MYVRTNYEKRFINIVQLLTKKLTFCKHTLKKKSEIYNDLKLLIQVLGGNFKSLATNDYCFLNHSGKKVEFVENWCFVRRFLLPVFPQFFVSFSNVIYKIVL